MNRFIKVIVATALLVPFTTACGAFSTKPPAYLARTTLKPNQIELIQDKGGPGSNALVNKGYQPVSISVWVKDGKKMPGRLPILRYAACGDKSLEECADGNPSDSRPFISTQVRSWPGKDDFAFKGRVSIAYPYNPGYSNISCAQEEDVETGTSLAITPATVSRLKEIGDYFHGKDFSYAGEDTHTKKLHDLTWKCQLTLN